MKNSEDFVNEFTNCVKAFKKEINDNEHSRYLSWEYCYESFHNAFNKLSSLKEEDYLNLSLQLAFYLASWGMYRGSSFLLQCDYKIHHGVVKLILTKEYKCLSNICWDKNEKNYQQCLDKLFGNGGGGGLISEIKNYYKNYRDKISKNSENNKIVNSNKENNDNAEDISDVLVTKILLGTLGCIPAYDKFLKKAMQVGQKFGINFTQKLGKKSFESLMDFYTDYKEKFEEQRNQLKLKSGKLEYPQMKFLDTGLWKLGLVQPKEEE